MKKLLFLHLPKTSGTTLKLFFKRELSDFFVQASFAGQLLEGDPLVGPVRDLDDIVRVLRTHGGLALHVDTGLQEVRKTKDFRSLAWYLFDPRYVEYFKDCTILTMLRHPFQSFLSSYAYVTRIQQRDPGFLPDLATGSLETYLDQVHENAILHFLLEPNLSRRRDLTRDDLERVEARIREYPIHVGIYERYEESIEYFARVLGRSFGPKDLPRMNAGPGASHYSPELEARFRAKNGLDLELYDFASRRLDEIRSLPQPGSDPR